jgi:hypothetical protein
MRFLSDGPRLDADPRVASARLLLLGTVHQTYSPGGELSFIKLSYLDFLLQLPGGLEALLKTERSGRNASRLRISVYERESIEARNLVLRFEPWNDKYRLCISSMVANGLAAVEIKASDERHWALRTTDRGAAVAKLLFDSPAYHELATRADVIVRSLDVRVATLQRYIANSLPETLTLEPTRPL